MQNLEEQLSISNKLKNVLIGNLKLMETKLNNDTVLDESYKDKLLEDVIKIRNNITGIRENYTVPFKFYTTLYNLVLCKLNITYVNINFTISVSQLDNNKHIFREHI